MAGEIDPKTGLLLQAPAGSTIDANGVVNRTPRYTADGAPVVAPPIDPNIPTAATGNPYGTDATGKPLPAPAGTTPIMNYDQFVADQKSKTAVDEAAIREQVRKEQQTRIDAVNNSYNSMVAEAGVTGQDRLGQSRALQSRSGLLGSDFGASQTDKVTKVNQSEVAAINAERDMKIQGVMDKIDSSVAERVKAQKEEAAGNVKAFQDYTEKAKTDAQDHIKTLAMANVDLAKYKEQAPDNYKNLVESSGYSEFEFASIYNASLPKAKQLTYDYKELKDGTLVRFASDGTQTTIKNAPPIPPDYQLTSLSNGKFVLLNKNTGEVKNYNVGGGNNSTTGDPKVDEVISAMGTNLNTNYKGKDGYINTEQYKRAYQDFAAKYPKYASKFTDYFPPTAYLNPNDATALGLLGVKPAQQ